MPICQDCGDQFFARAGAAYCSPACRQRAYRQRSRLSDADHDAIRRSNEAQSSRLKQETALQAAAANKRNAPTVTVSRVTTALPYTLDGDLAELPDLVRRRLWTWAAHLLDERRDRGADLPHRRGADRLVARAGRPGSLRCRERLAAGGGRRPPRTGRPLGRWPPVPRLNIPDLPWPGLPLNPDDSAWWAVFEFVYNSGLLDVIERVEARVMGRDRRARLHKEQTYPDAVRDLLAGRIEVTKYEALDARKMLTLVDEDHAAEFLVDHPDEFKYDDE